MHYKKFISWLFKIYLGLLPLISYASFIETTLGTAIVNDATASYFNPSALTLLKNPQIIPLATVARFQTKFTGQSTFVLTQYGQSGTSTATTYYDSPSFYLGLPINDVITIGFAGVSNFANRNPEENSILRYAQSSNSIQDYDFVPALGIKLNSYFSVGAGVNFSQTNFDLRPIIGFPGSNIPDSQSHNQSSGSGIGANIGFLLRPTTTTLIGLDYRTVTTYNESGKSVLTNNATIIVSNHYHFKMRTPARTILSLGQRINPTLGLIATIQRIQWNIIRNIHIEGIATPAGPAANITPFYLHNTWLLTLGGNYRFTPDWIVRVAATYNQSPDNGRYQLSTNDSYVLGASLGYKINKTFVLDGSYAHAFIKNQNININGNRFLIQGNNQSSRDVVSLKLTLNV